MNYLAKTLTYVLFFNISFSQSLWGFGKWYSFTPVQPPLLPETQKAEFNIFNLYNKGNILYCNGKYYINQSFPGPKPTMFKNFAEICLQKNLLSEQEFELIKCLNEGVYIDKNRILDYVNAFKKFIYCIQYYLQCIYKAYKLADDLNELYYLLDQEVNSYQELRNFIREFFHSGIMKDVKDYMHTELLMIFDNFYRANGFSNKPIHVFQKKPLVFISYYDMCEKCENFIGDVSHYPSVFNKMYQKEGLHLGLYKTLVGSFKPWEDSRGRHNPDDNDFLKVPLAFPNSIPTSSLPVHEEITTESHSFVSIWDFQKPQTYPLPASEAPQRLLYMHPMCWTSHFSAYPKKPAPISESPESAPANTSTSIPNIQTNDEDFDEDEVLAILAELEKSESQNSSVHGQGSSDVQETKKPSPLHTPKTQPANVPVTLPMKPGARPVILDTNQRPLKRARTYLPTSSRTNAVPESPKGATSDASTPALSVQTNSDDFDEDEALLKLLEQLEKEEHETSY